MGCGVSRAMGRRKGSLGISNGCVVHDRREGWEVCVDGHEHGSGVGERRWVQNLDEGSPVIDVT